MSDEISILFKKDKLEQLSYHISDLLCYLNGFQVGISLNKDPFDRCPFDFIADAFEDLRSLNIEIKSKLNEYEAFTK